MTADERPDRGPLPSGRSRHGLSVDEVTASQRARLVEAALRMVSEKGYARLTVADVAAAAQVSRRTFYEHFRDKEDCFMSAVDAGTSDLLGRMLRAAETTDDWVGKVERSATAYVEGLAAAPHLARAFCVEILAAGPRGLDFRAGVHRLFAEFYRDTYAAAREQQPDLPAMPAPAFRLATGAFDEFLLEWVRAGRLAELADLAPLARFLAVTLMTGAPAATAHLGKAAHLGADALPR